MRQSFITTCPRKGTAIPYLIHPVHVATILLRHGYGDTLAVAALLHDVLEDIDYHNGRAQLAIRSAFPRAGLPDAILTGEAFRTAFDAFLAAEFPGDVLSLVQAVTEPSSLSHQFEVGPTARPILLPASPKRPTTSSF